MVLRLLNSVYRESDRHPGALADSAAKAMQNARADVLPDTAEIQDKIVVTEFQFNLSDSLQTTELMAGMENEDKTYTLSVSYDSDSGKWEYEAHSIGGDAEIW